MQTSLYTPAGQPAEANPVVVQAIADLNAASDALQRAAYGLAFLTGGVAGDATVLLDRAREAARIDRVGPMADALELCDLVENFRDQIAATELAAMAQRAGGALRLGTPPAEAL